VETTQDYGRGIVDGEIVYLKVVIDDEAEILLIKFERFDV
jgi:hypothetical protein